MKRIFEVTLYHPKDIGVAQGMTYTVAAFTDIQARNLAVEYYTQLLIDTGEKPQKVTYCTLKHVTDIDIDIETFISKPTVSKTKPKKIKRA